MIIMRYFVHDDVIKWKHFPRNWPFVREIHRSPVNFPHKGQWRGALMFSLIYVWINDWVNNREAGDLRRQHGHYDVIVMCSSLSFCWAISLHYVVHLRTSYGVSWLKIHRSPVNSPNKGPATSNAENISIWWRHHAEFIDICFRYCQNCHPTDLTNPLLTTNVNITLNVISTYYPPLLSRVRRRFDAIMTL